MMGMEALLFVSLIGKKLNIFLTLFKICLHSADAATY